MKLNFSEILEQEAKAAAEAEAKAKAKAEQDKANEKESSAILDTLQGIVKDIETLLYKKEKTTDEETKTEETNDGNGNTRKPLDVLG